MLSFTKWKYTCSLPGYSLPTSLLATDCPGMGTARVLHNNDREDSWNPWGMPWEQCQELRSSNFSSTDGCWNWLSSASVWTRDGHPLGTYYSHYFSFEIIKEPAKPLTAPYPGLHDQQVGQMERRHQVSQPHIRRERVDNRCLVRKLLWRLILCKNHRRPSSISG